MQKKRTPSPVRTDTPGVYKRAARYYIKWREDGKTIWRSFLTYDEAVAFKRDYVLPYRRRDKDVLPPTSVMPPRVGTGWVYFFQTGGPEGMVKIGWSIDPAKRYRTLLVGCPHGLEMVALFPGSQTLEKRLHEEFAGWRRSGEWFTHEVLAALTGKLS